MTDIRRVSNKPKHRRALIALATAVALGVIVAYVPILDAGWVYDDVNLVQHSPAIKDLPGLVQAISTDLYRQAATRLEASPYWREGGYAIWGQFEVIMDQGKVVNEHFWGAHANPTGYGMAK